MEVALTMEVAPATCAMSCPTSSALCNNFASAASDKRWGDADQDNH